jgi:DNA topoisomerase-3
MKESGIGTPVSRAVIIEVLFVRNYIRVYMKQITAELLETKIVLVDKNTCFCLKYKTVRVCFYSRVAKCMDANCRLVIFQNISKKQLSDGQITDLLTNGKTAVIKGFKSKVGKSFKAALKFDENYWVTYDFPAKKVGKGKK